MDLLTPFEITYREEKVQVIPRKIGNDTVYILYFPTRRPPLMLSAATKQCGGRFWTTVPESKGKVEQDQALKEAEAIGMKITEHYQAQLIS